MTVMNNDTSIRIRPGQQQDIPCLVDFNLRMARETEQLELDPEVLAAGVRAVFENPHLGFYLVAESDGQVAGSLLVTPEWSDWRNGAFWWIQSVYVRPEYRRRGALRRLYQAVKEMAAQRSDVCGLRLYVEKDNASAQTCYQRLGMRPSHYRFFEE
ncbi:MAG: GNAT family N-acetyltransferase [Planctomycetales bacterium]|nr:GNAT family N-acetyltransferase [Planctomycetales bacterium]